MNSTPTTTGATAITGVMLAGVILWLCDLLRIHQPPVEVAGTIGAAMLYGAHVVSNWIDRRWPEPAQPVAVELDHAAVVARPLGPTSPPAS